MLSLYTELGVGWLVFSFHGSLVILFPPGSFPDSCSYRMCFPIRVLPAAVIV